MTRRVKIPAFANSLSARLLVLTILFVMLAEVFIYVPSIARFWKEYLDERLSSAQLAALTLEATPGRMIDESLTRELLNVAGVRTVAMRRDDKHILMLGDEADKEAPIVASYDLRDASAWMLIGGAFETLRRQSGACIRVIGMPPEGVGEYVEIVLPEEPLAAAMLEYSTRILGLSIVISLITAGLVFLSLHMIFVKPMRRITNCMVDFRGAPEDPAATLPPTRRRDEIGTAQRELRRMQEEVRGALRQKTRLANLGTAVTKISHDLRNILASAQLVSDRLNTLADPTVRHLTPTLMRSIDRAIALCERTLKYGRADEPPPEPRRQPLAPLLADVERDVGGGEDNRITWLNEIPEDLLVDADRDQLYRALLNLGRNSVEAMEDQAEGTVTVRGRREDGAVIIDFIDTGPGLSPEAQAHLFEAFAGTTRAEGLGLGLNIAREIIRAHGGDIRLLQTGPEGTVFRISLPEAPHRKAA